MYNGNNENCVRVRKFVYCGAVDNNRILGRRGINTFF